MSTLVFILFVIGVPVAGVLMVLHVSRGHVDPAKSEPTAARRASLAAQAERDEEAARALAEAIRAIVAEHAPYPQGWLASARAQVSQMTQAIGHDVDAALLKARHGTANIEGLYDEAYALASGLRTDGDAEDFLREQAPYLSAEEAKALLDFVLWAYR